MMIKQKSIKEILLATLFLAGCQFSKDSPHTVSDDDLKAAIGEAEKQRKDALSGFLLEKDITVTYVEQPEPGNYTAVLSWKKTIPYLIYTVRGYTNSIVNATSLSFSTFGRPDHIDIEAKNNLGLTVSKFQLTTDAPKDIILMSQALTQDTVIEANRVFLTENSKLVTEGHSLTIKTNKLIIMGKEAIISTLSLWSADITTKDPVLLKNSTINIQARSIEGSLDIYLYGLNGQDGLNGIELEQNAGVTEPAAGAPGGDAQTMSAPCNFPSDHGGRCNQEQTRDFVTFCMKPPENGGPGADAPNAMDGENGHPGSNSGDLILNTNKIDGNVEISRIVGLGGRGGAAAPVRAGGPGGPPGKVQSTRNPCPPAQDGPPGKTGLPGKAGSSGPDGKLGLLVLPSNPEVRGKISISDMPSHY